MSAFFNFFNRLFDNNSTSSSSAHKRRRSRTLRIEELESRDLLSVAPWSSPDSFDLNLIPSHEQVQVGFFG